MSVLVEARDQFGRQHGTAGTRIRRSNLREWLDGWRALSARRHSAERTKALDEHLAVLPEALVGAARGAKLDELMAVLRERQPSKGRREGLPTTWLLDGVDRARARAGSGTGGGGGGLTRSG